jgi:hypothetical protein
MDAMNILSSVMQDPEAMKKAMNIASVLSSSGALDGLMKNVSGESSSEKATEGVLANTEKHSENGSPSNPHSELPFHQTPTNAHSSVLMNQRLALLSAIHPYLSHEKAKKLDSVIGILKLIGTLENSGLKLF